MLLFVNISSLIILMMHYDVIIQIKGDLLLYLYHYSDLILRLIYSECVFECFLSRSRELVGTSIILGKHCVLYLVLVRMGIIKMMIC